MRRSFLRTSVISSSVLALLACGPRAPSALKSTVVPDGVFTPLGSAYDGIRGEWSGARCLSVTPDMVEDLSSNEAHVMFAEDVSSNEALALLDGSIGISVPIFPFVTVSGHVSLASEMASSRHASTFAYNFTVEGAASKLTGETVDEDFIQQIGPLTPPTNEDQVRPEISTVCGGEFVREVTNGASLTMLAKVEFATAVEKSRFRGAVGADVFLIGHLEAGLGLINEATKQSSRITIVVKQTGGEPERLLELLPEASLVSDGQGIQSVAAFKCSLANPDACAETMQRVIDYSQTSLTEQTSDQTLWSPVKIYTTPYVMSDQLAANAYDGLVMRRLEIRRQQLQAAYAARRGDDKTIETELSRPVQTLSAERRSFLDTTSAALKNDLDVLKSMLKICWSRPLECLNFTDDALDQLSFYDPEALQSGTLTFADWCQSRDLASMVNPDERAVIEAVLAALGTTDCTGAEAALQTTTSLDLRGKNLRTVMPLIALGTLESIDLSDNLITHVAPLQELPRLKTLILARNRIRSISTFASGSWTLDRLDLSRNYIESLSPLGLASWTTPHVDLSFNKIDAVPTLASTVGPKSLDLSGNRNIDSLGGLASLAALEHLSAKEMGDGFDGMCPEGQRLISLECRFD